VRVTAGTVLPVPIEGAWKALAAWEDQRRLMRAGLAALRPSLSQGPSPAVR
jgi:hypothetical protein